MKRQNQEPGNSREKPVEPGVSGDIVRVPEEVSFMRSPKDGVTGNGRCMSVRRLHTNELERLHGKTQGGNKAIEDELRRRGHNSKMLAEAMWDHDQRRWGKIAKKASEVSRRRKKSVRRAKLKRKRERRRERSRERLRQNRMDLLAKLKEGVEIVGENYDPSVADGTCPF